ncbi:hypothetical protein [Aurantiacibacter suaedae]|uniref:hypothetical protein n=1 Tax=Aurantiacibacter suaedae TaxID=2545755 RepID=UPI0010F6B56D|nr:hypothetical protein [Aurantiacibacter suaedae]
MKRLALLVALLAALAMPAPALAQPADPDLMAERAEELGEMFPVEPLTAEQEARLPAATALVEKIIPPGTMGEMMIGMFEGFFSPVQAMEGKAGKPPLAKLLGISRGQLVGVNSEAAARAATMLDPDWQLRKEREAEALPRAMNAMMSAMEPTIKSAMAEMYALHFDATELRDIDVFFSTESGAAYARKSFIMTADPRFAGLMMEEMPEMLAGIADMRAELEEATADLATPRSWYELDPAEQAKLADMLGMTREGLEASMSSYEAEGAYDY